MGLSFRGLTQKCNGSKGLAIELALTSSVNVTPINQSDTNEPEAALRLIERLNLHIEVS